MVLLSFKGDVMHDVWLLLIVGDCAAVFNAKICERMLFCCFKAVFILSKCQFDCYAWALKTETCCNNGARE